MSVVTKTVKGFFSAFTSWFSVSMKQTMSAYCDIQTADSTNTLVTNNGSLLSIIRIDGVKQLVGAEEFDRIQASLMQSLQTTMSQPGHNIQTFFAYNKEEIAEYISDVLSPAKQTAKRLALNLSDLFVEREKVLSEYCGFESCYLVLWTQLKSLSSEQLKQANKTKKRDIKENNLPPFFNTQNLMAIVPDLRDSHDSFVRLVLNDLQSLNFSVDLLDAHDALYAVRNSIDPDFTDPSWRPLLPGDPVTPKQYKNTTSEITDLLWPSIASQLFVRDD